MQIWPSNPPPPPPPPPRRVLFDAAGLCKFGQKSDSARRIPHCDKMKIHTQLAREELTKNQTFELITTASSYEK